MVRASLRPRRMLGQTKWMQGSKTMWLSYTLDSLALGHGPKGSQEHLPGTQLQMWQEITCQLLLTDRETEAQGRAPGRSKLSIQWHRCGAQGSGSFPRMGRVEGPWSSAGRLLGDSSVSCCPAVSPASRPVHVMNSVSRGARDTMKSSAPGMPAFGDSEDRVSTDGVALPQEEVFISGLGRRAGREGA